MQSCKSCKFWFKTETGPNGYCVRYPPSIQQDQSPADAWPVADADGWCGEFAHDLGALVDKIEGLEADLEIAVGNIWKFDDAGKLWCRANHPKLAEKFEARDKTA